MLRSDQVNFDSTCAAGLPTGMVFLDLSKAFDTLDHDTILEKLYSLGFSDSAVFWFKAYLTNRTQRVNVNGVFSDPQSIQFGVPRGSILAPLRFIVYINNLPSVVQSCDIQLYADDTLLFFSSNSTAEIETYLSEDLNSIISWLENNFLFLNYSKTKIMLVGSQQKLARVADFCITARNKTLGRVYEFKYLGVMLDPCLSWNDHIDLISTKISSRLGMLRKARRVIPLEVWITLYDTMILPLFDYCSAVWDGCGKTNRDYLDKLQRRKYQICLQIFKCLNGLAPAYLLHDFHYSRDFHAYNTRNKDLLRLPLAKTTKYQTSFRYNGAKAWNDLPYKLRIENSLSKFNKGLCTPKSSKRD